MNRVLSLIVLIAMVTGCSSGGAGGSSIPVQTPAKTAPQSVGTTTLTIKFPATFGVAAQASVKGARPQFVNPITTNFLDVYVDQQLVLLPGGPANDTAQISNANGDGTQTLSIPQYSTGINDVVVAERDSGGNPITLPGHLLALGQANANSIGANGPGTTNSASINMSMNLGGFAYSTNGTSATSIQSDTIYCVGNSPGTTPIQFVPIDPSGGFTLSTPAGNGGLATLTVQASAISPTVAPPSNIASTLGGSYSLIYDSAHVGDADGVGVFIAAGNPANIIWQDSLTSADQAMLPLYLSPGPGTINQTATGVNFFPLNNLAECG
jgi:hypothetical protein